MKENLLTGYLTPGVMETPLEDLENTLAYLSRASKNLQDPNKHVQCIRELILEDGFGSLNNQQIKKVVPTENLLGRFLILGAMATHLTDQESTRLFWSTRQLN